MLITSPDHFTPYVTIGKGISMESIRAHVRNAERTYLRPALGNTLFDALDAYVASNATNNSTYNSLLPYVREALALLSMATLLPDIAVQTSDAGAQVAWSDNYRPALQGQIDAKGEALQICGMTALDALYDYLQGTNPSSWRTSSAGQLNNQLLIRTAAEFEAGYPIRRSRTTYIDLQPRIRRAQEFDVAPVLGETFWAALLAYNASGSTSDTYYNQAISKLRIALAPLAISRANDVVLQFVNGGLISTRFLAASNSQDAAHALTGGPANMVSSMKVNAGNDGRALLAKAQKWMDENAGNLSGYTARTNYTDLPDVAGRIHNNDSLAAF